MQIGTYRVEYEGQGFKRSVRDQVVLTAGATMRLDITLELGSAAESVTVSAQATPIEVESTRVATNITTKLVQDLALLVDGGIRSIFTLASIAPETHGSGQGYRIGGGPAVGWEMLMDGMPMTSPSTLYQGDRASLGSVPIDAINEFPVETSGMKAEYGFDPTATNPDAGGRRGPMVFSGSGTGRMTGTLFDACPYAIAPRISLAHRTVGHTVIRLYGGRTFSAVKTSGGSTHFEGFIVNRTQNSSDGSVNDFPAILENGLPIFPTPPTINPSLLNNGDTDLWQRRDSGRPSEYWT